VVESTSENAQINNKNQIKKTKRKPDRRKKRPKKLDEKKRAVTARRCVLLSGSVPVQSVFLVGFMGAGKSTVGSALAARLHCAFEDLDDRIVRRERRTVAGIFRDSGEKQFRSAERAALLELLDELQSGGRRVVALGGGAFAQPGNVKLIEASGVRTVFLDAPVGELWRRCCAQADQRMQRPLLNSWESFRRLYQLRRSWYLKAKHLQKTGNMKIDQVVAQIVEALDIDPRKP
jgi:shikimate kinase